MNALKIITLSFAFTLCACMVIFSDLFWFHNQSMLWHHDAEIPYESVFFLISNFFQGGLQIFDRYDGMTFAFNHLGHGLYTLSNILTALVGIVLLPFQSNPGEAFQHIFSLVHPAFNILLRLIGGYVLLRKFKLNDGMIIIALVILNTFLSSSMYLGLVANNLYSYFPFLAYFIISYVEKFQTRDFIGFVLLLIVAIAGNPLLGAGYFYQNVHFLMMVALIYGIIFHRRNISFTGMVAPKNLKAIGITIVIGACIILPSVMFFNILGKDFFVEGSGLNGTQGRFSRMFNPQKYFAPKGETILPLTELPEKLIDFTNATWEKSWIFWGAAVVLLIFMGLICSKIRAKYVFAIASTLVLLTNVPLNDTGLLSVAHWINALTNPFSFLLRSYHMPVLLLPYLIFPLVAFGLQSGYDMLHDRVSQIRLRVLLAVYLMLLFLSAWFLSFEFKTYMLLMLSVAILYVYVCQKKLIDLNGVARKHVGIFLFCVFMGVDVFALKQYYDNNQYHGEFANRGGYLSIKDGRHIKPSVYDGFEDQRSLLVDYQNPKILPFREYFRILPSATDPHMHTFQGHYGYFFSYMPLERFADHADIYEPRPKIYQDWGNNQRLYQALAQDQRFLVLASGTPEGPRQMLPARVREFQIPLSKAQMIKNGNPVLYAIKLPKSFPSYESTAIFTQDRNRLILEGLESLLTPVQGAIAESFTFDVNNVKDGYLVLGLPKGYLKGNIKLTLRLVQSGDILNIWRNTSDQLGVTFQASTDGWLIAHYPYDEKWQVWIDGKRAAISKVNGYFLGVPISAGKHQVLFKYWPNSPLRVLIPLSILLSMGVVIWAVRRAVG